MRSRLRRSYCLARRLLEPQSGIFSRLLRIFDNILLPFRSYTAMVGHVDRPVRNWNNLVFEPHIKRDSEERSSESETFTAGLGRSGRPYISRVSSGGFPTYRTAKMNCIGDTHRVRPAHGLHFDIQKIQKT